MSQNELQQTQHTRTQTNKWASSRKKSDLDACEQLSLVLLVFVAEQASLSIILLDFDYLCFLFFMLSCLFIAALWSPAGKGLTSWLSCM